jgi:hypothetical protein
VSAGPRGPGAFFVATALLGAALAAFLYHEDLPQRVGFDLDAFHHLAAVRELARGEFPPHHNLVPGAIHQGHYGPYLVSLGLIARLTGANSTRVLYAAGVANLLLYLLAFRWLVGRLVGPGATRWAAVVPLLLWGPWPSLDMTWASLGWPGTTSIAEPYNFFYPNQAGLILTLGLLAWLASGGPGAALLPFGRRKGLLATAATAVLITTHPLSAILFAATLGALGLAQWMSAGLRRADAAWLAALPAGGLLIATLWPYYPVLGLLPSLGWGWLRTSGGPVTQVAIGPLHHVILPVAAPALSFVDLFGPAVFGSLGLVLLAVRRRPFPLLWFGMLLAMVFCPYVPMRQRFAFFAVIPLHVGACLLFEEAWSRGRLGRAALAAVLACGALSAGLRLDWALQREAVSLAFLEPVLPEDAVVLANQTLSNGVAGLTGRKVVCPQNPDMFVILAGGARRIYDVDSFLQPGTSRASRDRIARHWHATHLLVDRLQGPQKYPYRVVARQGGFVLYELAEDAARPASPKN